MRRECSAGSGCWYLILSGYFLLPDIADLSRMSASETFAELTAGVCKP